MSVTQVNCLPPHYIYISLTRSLQCALLNYGQISESSPTWNMLNCKIQFAVSFI